MTRVPRTFPIAAALALVTIVAASASRLSAQNVPTGFVVEPMLTTGLALPNDCAFLPDGRVLVANSAGAVTLLAGGSAVTIGTVPSVETGGERGLLSLAPDPAFATNGHLFVYYARTGDAFLHLDRFTCTGDLDDPTSTNLAFAASSRRTVIDSIPDNASNHNGGSLRFGLDGMLHLTVGDDAVACNAQSLTTRVGCLLRLHVADLPPGGGLAAPSIDALDPGDNPLSGAADFRQLVLAHGLRNPFRMEIDPLTGNLYIADVGAATEEELSEYVWPAGALPLRNYGWPWREGASAGFGCGGTAPTGLVAPIASVHHNAGWSSIMAGPRYRNLGRGHDFGGAYEGSVFYADFGTGQMRRLVEQQSGWQQAPAVPGQPSATNWSTGWSGITSLRLGPDGALWATLRLNGSRLLRIRPQGPVHDVVAISGGGQFAPAGEMLPAPLVVRVFDERGDPLPGASVAFTVEGSATLSTSNPVIADANGFAQTVVTTTPAGGPVTVRASTPGGDRLATFAAFARRLSVSQNGAQLTVAVGNESPAPQPIVPMLLMVSLAGAPPLPTVIGPLCTDPFHPLTVVVEDSIGLLGSELGGTGLIGSPDATKVYGLPTGFLSGIAMQFQVVGLDPVLGWFRTNCEPHLFP